MNAEVWENAPADEHATDNLDSLMPALSTLNSPTHDPCKVRQVFFPSCHEREMLHVSQATDIAELRLEAAAACQGCELLLDAATTHIHERLQEDQIASIRFWGQSWEPGGYQIVLELRDCVDKAEKSSPPKLDDIILEIFQPKGQEQDNAIASSYHLKPACFVKTVSLPSEDTSSDRALHTLQEWIKNCVEKHGVCGRSSPSQLPKQILEIDDTCVYVRENLGSPAKYACLSHCWGKTGPSFRLEEASYCLLQTGISIGQLPKTFRDAVTLCARLNLKYIWIDALCIRQDDKDDWEEAATTMAGIYAQAHITIAALWSNSSDGGLIAPNRSRYKARRLRFHDVIIREEPPRFPNLYRESEHFPLLTRAWVFQERLLSQRIVHFGKDQLYWHCRYLFDSESCIASQNILAKGISHEIDVFDVDEDPIRRWHHQVTIYSRLKLTYESDRLPAIAAIVEREIRIRPGDVYIAGMWRNSLLEDISWTTSYGSKCPHPLIKLPKWAWSATKEGVIWSKQIRILKSLTLVDLSFTRVGPVHVGEVKDASITLRGATYTTYVSGLRKTLYRSSAMVVHDSSTAKFPFSSSELYPDFDWETVERPVRVGDTFLLLLLGIETGPIRWHYRNFYGLILREITNDVFERMGKVMLFCDIRDYEEGPDLNDRLHDDLTESLPIRKVKII